MIKLDIAIWVRGTSHLEEIRAIYRMKQHTVTDVSTVQDGVLVFPFGLVSIRTVIGDLDKTITLRPFRLWCDPHLESCRWTVSRKG